MLENQKKKGYLQGDIMGRGDFLARKEELEKMNAANVSIDFYSPVLNKSINDKQSVTVEENNGLSRKIFKADVDRMWAADIIVACPEQKAIGTLVETGISSGWKWVAEKYFELETPEERDAMMKKLAEKEYRYHYYDLRNTDIPEVGWNRSFSINQFLRGAIQYNSPKEIEEFSDIVADLSKGEESIE